MRQTIQSSRVLIFYCNIPLNIKAAIHLILIDPKNLLHNPISWIIFQISHQVKYFIEQKSFKSPDFGNSELAVHPASTS